MKILMINIKTTRRSFFTHRNLLSVAIELVGDTCEGIGAYNDFSLEVFRRPFQSILSF